MPEEALQTARRVMEALSRGDLAALAALSDPDVEWQSFFAALSEGGIFRGGEGTRQYVGELQDAFEFLHAEVEDGLAVGDIAVLVGRIHYRGKGSGVETATPAGWMFKLRQGKVLRFRAFREPAQALEDVGLEEGHDR
jgi:ketosteroid isomerase-like protein